MMSNFNPVLRSVASACDTFCHFMKPNNSSTREKRSEICSTL